ncbi:hypothetical protein CTI12_AA471340 [Artemisia annua]|uniref:Uncharacterized protein n=1 Tax=Artemisia annua TaxID=35608 RepID=A0A2U1LNP0_ARTAN|nr:hypothetical protein CTI12_AA471340 [Artemisia annua]
MAMDRQQQQQAQMMMRMKNSGLISYHGSPMIADDEDELSKSALMAFRAFTDPLKLPIIHSKILAQDGKETTEIYHWRHPAHPLVLNVEDSQGNNMIPDINSGDPIKWGYGISYACKDCDFLLGMECAMRAPKSLAHRYCKGHEIPLTYPPVEDHPEDFYCDICEEEMDPKLWLYHSFHLGCISRRDYYANVWYGGTRLTRAYHKHPLTFVRRKKTPKCHRKKIGYWG